MVKELPWKISVVRKKELPSFIEPVACSHKPVIETYHKPFKCGLQSVSLTPVNAILSSITRYQNVLKFFYKNFENISCFLQVCYMPCPPHPPTSKNPNFCLKSENCEALHHAIFRPVNSHFLGRNTLLKKRSFQIQSKGARDQVWHLHKTSKISVLCI
jgi:hypothetical protein